MTITQGAQANLNGKTFEEMMIPIFKMNGFQVFTESELKKKYPDLSSIDIERYVIKNAYYVTIYNEGGRTEFVIVDGTRRVRVEAKYQASAGSVDEKYPYMLLNGIYQYPENEIVFVVDGGGYKPGARQWLEDKIKENWLDYKSKGKDISLMSISQFVNWFNHEFSRKDKEDK